MRNNKNICILPFISMDRNPYDEGLPAGPCCMYQQQKEKIYDFKTYWHSNELKELRDTFRKKQKPKGCWKCFEMEDKGKKSIRQNANDSRLKKYQNIINLPDAELVPVEIKLKVGALCNLACRMCVTNVSSRVNAVYKSIGWETLAPYKYDLDAEKMLKLHAKTVEYIDVIGGEPFYNKRLIELLNWLKNEGHSKHMTMYITSNGMFYNEKLVELLKSFKDVVLIISLDGIGKVHEYIRPGCDFNLVENNITKFRDDGINVLVQSTISLLNVLHLTKLDDWCLERKIHNPQKHIVYDPKELHPRNLPEKLKEQVPESYKKFIIEQPTDDYKTFISKLDQYWKTDIKNFMPEWGEHI